MNAAQLMFPEDAALLGRKSKKRVEEREESSCGKVSEVELEKMTNCMEKIHEDLSKIAKNKNDSKIAEQISRWGDKISNQIASSCTDITRAMNRSNELQEWNQIYMLQEAIIELEDQLIQLGVLKEVYKDMQVCKIPSISMTDEQIQIVMAIFAQNPKGYKQFKDEIYQTCCHPIEVLKGKEVKFYEGKATPDYYTCYMEICGCGARIEIDFRDLKIKAKRQGKKEILCCNGKEYVLDIPDGRDSLCLLIKCSSSIIRVKMDDNLSKEIFRYWTQKSGDVAENQWDFENFLESVNRKIELKNLRNLWFSLREAVRKHKMNLN